VCVVCVVCVWCVCVVCVCVCVCVCMCTEKRVSACQNTAESVFVLIPEK